MTRRAHAPSSPAAASGIGLAISERLAADGIAVAVLDRNGDAADEAAAKITAAGGTAIGVAADVTDRAQHRRRRRRGRASGSARPTILVNNAGLDGFAPFLKITPRDVEPGPRGEPHRHVPLLPGRRAPHDRGGLGPDRQHLVVERPGRPAADDRTTSSSKAAVIGLTKALALELGPKGITVNTIPPGFIDTPMLRDVRGQGPARRGRRAPREPHAGPPRRPPRGHRRRLARSSSATRLATSPARCIGVNGGRNTGDGAAHPAAAARASGRRRCATRWRRSGPPNPRHPFPSRDPTAPKGLNALGTLAHHPALTTAFHTLQRPRPLRLDAHAPPARAARAARRPPSRGATYEWAQHAVLAGDAGHQRRGGRADRARGPTPTGWAPLDAALLRAADELVADAAIADAHLGDPRRGSSTPQQLMDVVFTVGAYDLLAMAFRTFGVELDDDLAGNALLRRRDPCYHRRRRPTGRGTDDGALREARRGQLDRALPRAGHRPGVLRGLDLARALRARARGHLPPARG